MLEAAMAMVDDFFEKGQAAGVRVRCGLCDKRLLLPLPQLPEAVKTETAEEISLEELERRATEGWFSLVEVPGGRVSGVPLYVPSRVGLFLSLEREGWSSEELRLVAGFEESQVEHVLAADELVYTDDDLETLILFAKGQIDALEGSDADGEGHEVDRGRELAAEREQLEVLQTMKASGIPGHLALRVARDAFRVRVTNDMLRAWLLDWGRAKVKAGYSPLISFRSSAGGPQGFEGGEIDWDWTVRSSMAEAEGEAELPLRLPGFVLRGDRVATTRTFRPAEYGSAWRKHALDSYLEAWARLRNERCCLNCHGVLPPESNDRRLYCGDKCRQALKQRRYRERHPEAVEKAQAKYWFELFSTKGGNQ